MFGIVDTKRAHEDSLGVFDTSRLVTIHHPELLTNICASCSVDKLRTCLATHLARLRSLAPPPIYLLHIVGASLEHTAPDTAATLFSPASARKQPHGSGNVFVYSAEYNWSLPLLPLLELLCALVRADAVPRVVLVLEQCEHAERAQQALAASPQLRHRVILLASNVRHTEAPTAAAAPQLFSQPLQQQQQQQQLTKTLTGLRYAPGGLLRSLAQQLRSAASTWPLPMLRAASAAATPTASAAAAAAATSQSDHAAAVVSSSHSRSAAAAASHIDSLHTVTAAGALWRPCETLLRCNRSRSCLTGCITFPAHHRRCCTR